MFVELFAAKMESSIEVYKTWVVQINRYTHTGYFLDIGISWVPDDAYHVCTDIRQYIKKKKTKTNLIHV